MKSASKKRAAQLRQYSKRVREWLKENPQCEACTLISALAPSRPIRPATECHHMRGRNGGLLLDEQYWLPVCLPCHRWITDHGKLARELGLSGDVNYREMRL